MRIVLTALALSLALAACGGGGEGDEQAITDVIVASATTDDPADCLELYTKEFLERSSGLSGSAAIELCEEGTTKSLDAESVAVTKIDVEGSSAIADAAFVGSGLDGQTITIGLVDRGGSWKLDEFQSFASFDRDKLLEAVKQEIDALASSKLAVEIGRCVLERLGQLSDSRLEETITGGASGVMRRLGEDCARRAQGSPSI